MFILIWFSALLLQISTATSAVEPTVELKAVLTAVFTDKELAFYLDKQPVSDMAFLFRYEELPIYDGVTLSKPVFNIDYNKNKIVRYNLKMPDEENGVTIIVESIKVANGFATVKLRVPRNGVVGEYSLHKEQAKWVVVKAVVEQT